VAALAPNAPVFALSAHTGEGVADWVDRLLGESEPAPTTLAIDYEAYARGEAELAWLNGSFEVRGRDRLRLRAVGEVLMTELLSRARRQDLFLPHAKVLLASSKGSARIAVTRAREAGAWTGDPDLPPEAELSGIVNARAATEPGVLRTLIEEALAATGSRLGAALEARLECFRPPRPVPRYRLAGSALEA